MTDALLRERESMFPGGTLRAGAPQQPPQNPQDVRYQHQSPQDRGYPVPRSRTPLSRVEHAPHPSMQHPSHGLVDNNNHVILGQRQEELQSSAHRMRESYPPRDDRERVRVERTREEQAQHQARMRADGYLPRDRDLGYREEMLRRERNTRYADPSAPPGPPGPVQRPPEQRGTQQSPMDWANAVHPRR